MENYHQWVHPHLFKLESTRINQNNDSAFIDKYLNWSQIESMKTIILPLFIDV